MIQSRMTPDVIRNKKQRGEKIAMLTAYDYASASVAEEAGADIILVGDSLGITILGYHSTRDVTLSDMIHHLRAVVRGVRSSFIVCDLPVNTYRNEREAIENSNHLLENGCHAVKLEGCLPDIVAAVSERQIPIMGHIGFTPQTIQDFQVQGKGEKEAERLCQDADCLQQKGCFAVVLEGIPAVLGKTITERLSIPTIGIGAGPYCNGQVLVFNDLLGIFDKFKPKFVRQYRHLRKEMVSGCRAFIEDVRSGSYPQENESYL